MLSKEQAAKQVCNRLEILIPRLKMKGENGDQHAEISFEDLKILLCALDDWEKAQ